MINFPSFVLIDDKESELKDILNSFVGAGIPCVPIQYMHDDPNNTTGLDHVELESLKPRVIITDLNLKELSASEIEAVNLVGPIADVIKKIIDTGPYILYFWSKNPGLVNDVMDLLESRFKKKIQLPIHWGVINKNNYKENPQSLKERVKKLIQECPVFHALLDWENRVARAAVETTNSLYNLTMPDVDINVLYKDAHQASMKNVLSAIGNETLGIKNAKEYPSDAMDFGLAPVLQDHLHSVLGAGELWKEALPEIGSKVEVDDKVKSALNSFYHVEQVSTDFPKNCKGAFVLLSKSLRSSSDARKKFESRLGRTIDEVLKEEFISTIKLKGKDKPEMRSLRASAHTETIFGLVEISADCDQAQRKTKLHRYLLAALIPNKFKEIAVFETNGVHRETSHDGIYKTPVLLIDDEEYILKLSFKYQFGANPESFVNDVQYENSWLGIPKFRLREKMLADIVFKCAQYSTRPGIICFR